MAEISIIVVLKSEAPELNYELRIDDEEKLSTLFQQVNQYCREQGYSTSISFAAETFKQEDADKPLRELGVIEGAKIPMILESISPRPTSVAEKTLEFKSKTEVDISKKVKVPIELIEPFGSSYGSMRYEKLVTPVGKVFDEVYKFLPPAIKEKAHFRTEFTVEVIENLRLLQTAACGREISPGDMTRLQDFLATQTMGNMSLNAVCRVDILRNIAGSGVSYPVSKFMLDLSFRGKHFEAFNKIGDTICNRFVKILRGETLKPQEKISLRDYGLLHDMAKLHELLKKLKKHRLLNDNMMAVFKKTQIAAHIVFLLNNDFGQFQYPPGSIYFRKPAARVKNENQSVWQTLKEKAIMYGHVAKGVPQEGPRISHIDPSFKVEQVPLLDFLYNDQFKLNIEKLISPSSREILQKALGENWLKEVMVRYQQIDREVHDELVARSEVRNKKLGFAATDPDIVKIGFSRIFRLSAPEAEYKVRRAAVFHKSPAPDNIPGHTNMLCSEFVAINLNETINRLNKELDTALGREQGSEPLIELAISTKEPGALLEPRRLYQLLSEKRLISVIEPPSLVTAFIQLKPI